MSSEDAWATQYLIDPLTAPQPSAETGPGSQLRPDPESFSSKNPYRTNEIGRRRSVQHGSPTLTHGPAKESSMATTRELLRDPATPPKSPSHRQEAFSSQGGRSRRSSSLKERFPGDPSVRPLGQLAREKAQADKARHITKKHQVRPDTIDRLDDSGLGSSQYHHEGPYDATLFARNNSYRSSPVAAVAETNHEALKATPREKVVDSVERHRPLDGVAAYAPGEVDQNGHRYQYEQGENMMIDNNPGGGAYKRWPGIQYHPDDIKGKGEPSYSIEKALKEHSLNEKTHGRHPSQEGMEMTSKSRHGSESYAIRAEAFGDNETTLGRSGSLSNRLKKRVGSIKKRLSQDG